MLLPLHAAFNAVAIAIAIAFALAAGASAHDLAGTNNYSLLTPAVRAASSCTVRFSANAFIPSSLGVSIPQRTGEWFPILRNVPLSSNPITYLPQRIVSISGVYGNTDHRAFSSRPGASSKMRVELTLPVDRIGALTQRDVTRSVGHSTIAVVIKYRKPRFGWPPWETRQKTLNITSALGTIRTYRLSNLTNARGRESHISIRYGVENALGKGISIASVQRFLRYGLNLIGAINPDIDLELSLRIRVLKPDSAGMRTVTVIVRGSVQEFPNFEAFLNGDSLFRAATDRSRVFPSGIIALGGPPTRAVSWSGEFMCAGRPSRGSSSSPPTSSSPSSSSAATARLCRERPLLGIRSGSRNVVRNLQTLLNMKAGAGLKVDGLFGRNTDSAVRSWQARSSLKVDGLVGSQTWRSLCSFSPIYPIVWGPLRERARSTLYKLLVLLLIGQLHIYVSFLELVTNSGVLTDFFRA